MSIIFQQNKLFFFSDSLLSLVVLDETLEANGESRYISGGVHSVIAVDKEKNTWIFTVPTWQYLILTKDQATHIEGQQRLTSAKSIDSKAPNYLYRTTRIYRKRRDLRLPQHL